MQNSDLWNISFLASINKASEIVRNNVTGELMLRRECAPECFSVMQRLTLIRNQNLMTVFDARIINGKCVTLNEFINGATLENRVEHMGIFQPDEAKNILAQICDGLSALHINGIVHRDIKPSNIMIDSNGNVKIIDYDISRTEKPERLRDTTIMGTEGYAPPEQFGFAQTGARADIYSCGVLLNYLLTGKLPQEERCTGALGAVVERCIEIDENKRFNSAEELKQALLGKKFKRKREFRPLPGFRSKRILPKIITVILIAAWFNILYIFIIGGTGRNFYKYGARVTWDYLLQAAMILIFWSALPYFLFGDIFRLSEKISPNNPQNGIYILRVLGVISFIIGIGIFYFVSFVI